MPAHKIVLHRRLLYSSELLSGTLLAQSHTLKNSRVLTALTKSPSCDDHRSKHSYKPTFNLDKDDARTVSMACLSSKESLVRLHRSERFTLTVTVGFPLPCFNVFLQAPQL
jgi:hypothetical protein